jgi:predicted SAM-dependent methyltransferase
MLNKYLIGFAKAVIPAEYHGKAAAIYCEAESIRRAAPFIGITYHCPCCGWHLRKFLPYGVILRPNALCPRCKSLERHRLLWLYFKDRTNLFRDRLRLLHFAPEQVFEATFKSLDNLDYITADLYSDRAMVKMDITNITYGDNSFDAILCSHVLEHVMDDKKAMREMFRVLKPGGWAIIMVPILAEATFEDPSIVTPEDREGFFGQWDHVRMYGPDLKDRLESAGFDVKVDGYVRELGKSKIRRYGLLESHDIYFCTKPRAKSIE